ncbi:hypothetical protein Cni_G10026 [Canna indica]|uniref:ZF-HD dimerization-type domain-containing protein n=1 Tax=Canna indica TaxID=4628 RepID=A0AAQ3K5F7_9LILI|nr:hypothetical protein Cni_G10026 [Canna indica]
MDLPSHEEGEIPITITSAYIGDDDDHAPPPILQHHSTHRPPPSLSIITTEDRHHQNTTSSKKGRQVVRYRECLKNHAASIGGNATDGCGEFMPSGEESSLEALHCSACSCHRNFHRKEIDGEPSSCDCFHPLTGRKVMPQRGLLISSPDHAFGYTHPPPPSNSLIPRVILPLGAMQTSESDEMEGMMMMTRPPMVIKKRIRTKFTPEQKDRMLEFAEKVGWSLQRKEESLVQQFCQEIGVKRRVLKVWMHNNKHSLAKKTSHHLQPTHS